MKKFLLVAALVFSVVIGQFAQAQAYTPQEGDKAIIYRRGCHWCYMIYHEALIYRNKQLIVEDKAPVYGCSKDPHHNGEHYWSGKANVSYYLFTGGEWQEVINY